MIGGTMSALTWPDVAYFLIVAAPGLIAAWFGAKNARALKTGNEKSVGQMLTEVHGQESEQSTPYETHG